MNEEVEINVRQEVQDVFERNFDREAAYEQRLLRLWEDMNCAENSHQATAFFFAVSRPPPALIFEFF